MKNNTTSILLNVLASIIAFILFLLGIVSIFSFELITGFLFILAAIVLSPLSKIMFSEISTKKIKIGRVIIPLVLLFIGLLFAMDEPKINNNSEKATDIEQENNEEGIQLVQLKDSLNLFLKSKQLNVCLVIGDISKIENLSIKDADKKYPDFGRKHSDYTYQLIDIRTKKYLKNKGIDSLTHLEILTFVMECTESERQERILELKKKKSN